MRPGLRRAVAGLLIAGGLSGVAPSARAEICTYVVIDPLWKGYMTTIGKYLDTAFDTNRAAVITAMTVGFGRLTSAVRVDTSQSSLNGGQTATAIAQGQQAYADAVSQQMIAEQILRAQNDYGPSGQSVNACASAIRLSAAARSFDAIPTRAAAILRGVHAAPGSAITGQQAVASRLQRHRASSCSPSEAQAGLCGAAGARPSADVLAATLLDPDADPATVQALIDNIAGDPLTKPTAAAVQTPEGAIRMAVAVRAEALRSPALVSLAAIRAQYAPDAAGGVSAARALDDILATYGGGVGYEAWSAELATKQSHGLLQELNKLSALQLKIRSLRSDSNARVSVTWAALLAAEADAAR